MDRDFKAEAFALVVKHSREGGSMEDARRAFDDSVPIGHPVPSHVLIRDAKAKLNAIPHALDHALAIASQLELDRDQFVDRLDAYLTALDVIRHHADPPLNAEAINAAYVAASALRSMFRPLPRFGSNLPTFQQMRDGQ